MSHWLYSSSLYLCFLGATRWMAFFWCSWLAQHKLKCLFTKSPSDRKSFFPQISCYRAEMFWWIHCTNIQVSKGSYLPCNKKWNTKGKAFYKWEGPSPPLLKLGTSIITQNHDSKVVSQRPFPGTKGLSYCSKNFLWNMVHKYGWIKWLSGPSYKTRHRQQ